MYLIYTPSGDLVEILDLDRLLNPLQKDVNGRFLADEAWQAPVAFGKDSLVFPSGESLPRCWVTPTNKVKLRIVGG